MNNSPYSDEEAHRYWMERHQKSGDIWRTVGHKGEEEAVNAIFYQCRRMALQYQFKRLQINPKGLRVLDVGCGVGIFSQFYSDAGAEVFGLDISKDAVDQCNSLGIGTFVQGTVGNVHEYFDVEFDIIHCFDLLYHVTTPHEWEGALAGFSTLSKPSTIWFVTEIHSKKTYASAPHVMKRAESLYRTQLLRNARYVEQSVPLYWLYQLSPQIARRFPNLTLSLDEIGQYLSPLFREHAALWVIRSCG